jgi:hypothetical protein
MGILKARGGVVCGAQGALAISLSLCYRIGSMPRHVRRSDSVPRYAREYTLLHTIGTSNRILLTKFGGVPM